MLRAKRYFRMTVVMLCLFVCGAEVSFANIAVWENQPTGWWPDGTTGLMWANQATTIGKFFGINWQGANDYCSALKLGGYTGWRLPTKDEAMASTYIEDLYNDAGAYVSSARRFKGDLYVHDNAHVWTSTVAGDQKYWGVSTGPLGSLRPTYAFPATDVSSQVALCVRTMDPDLLAIAKEGPVEDPVQDVAHLKMMILHHKAVAAYGAGQYAESLAFAEQILQVDPGATEPDRDATGHRDMGVAYGMLGQWDEAIAQLQMALAINKKYKDANGALKWAKSGQKAASKGKKVKPFE